MLQNYLTFQVLIKLKLLGSIHKNWSPNLRNIPSAVSEGAEACVLFPWHRDPVGCEWHRYSSWGALLWAGEASSSWHSAQTGRKCAGAHGSRWVEKKYPSVQGRRWAWARPRSWFSWAGGDGCLWQNSVCQFFAWKSVTAAESVWKMFFCLLFSSWLSRCISCTKYVRAGGQLLHCGKSNQLLSKRDALF